MVNDGPVLAGLATAFPPAVVQQDLWEGFFADYFTGVRGARRIFASVRVAQRHPAVDPRNEDVSRWSTAQRMTRYREESLPLAKEAIAVALKRAAVDVADLGLLIVVSCTGYASPGLETLVAQDIGLPPAAQRLLIGQLGCHAALPAIAVAEDRVRGTGRPALVLCVELSSLHLQPPSHDVEQIVCHALFGDGAGAAVICPAGASGLRLVDRSSGADLAAAEHLTWEITDHGFRMHLDRRLPQIVGDQVAPLVDELLVRNGLDMTRAQTQNRLWSSIPVTTLVSVPSASSTPPTMSICHSSIERARSHRL